MENNQKDECHGFEEFGNEGCVNYQDMLGR